MNGAGFLLARFAEGIPTGQRGLSAFGAIYPPLADFLSVAQCLNAGRLNPDIELLRVLTPRKSLTACPGHPPGTFFSSVG